LFGLLYWCVGVAISLWLCLYAARRGGELAFSNIKISLGAENGTDLGGEFVTHLGDFWGGYRMLRKGTAISIKVAMFASDILTGVGVVL
jgi:hypothetical protein